MSSGLSRSLQLGFAVFALAGCPKSGEFPFGPDAQAPVAATTVDTVSGDAQARFARFMAGLHQKEATVQPTTGEIRIFSEAEVANGMLERYRNFSDHWWAFVHQSNRGATAEQFILPAAPKEDPIFTEIIVPMVKGMALSPEQRRGVLEEYRFRTLTGLRDDMQQLLQTELMFIAPDVMRQRPEAVARHEVLVANFHALEDRFITFQNLDFAQILGMEEASFERVTTEQAKVVAYAHTFKQPSTLEEAAPLIVEVGKKLDGYQKKLNLLPPNTPEYSDVLSSMMLLMEFQTRLMDPNLGRSPAGEVGITVIEGDEFEAMPVTPRTPMGTFDLEIRDPTENPAPANPDTAYNGNWSHWAEWYGVASYYLAMRHFDDDRTQYAQEVLENQACVGLGFATACPAMPIPFDPMKAWVEGVAFAQATLKDTEAPDYFWPRYIPPAYAATEPSYPHTHPDMQPPVYRFTGDYPKFPKYPVVVAEPTIPQGKNLNVTAPYDAFPAYCTLETPKVTDAQGTYYYIPERGWGGAEKESWHFTVVSPDSKYSPYGRESFRRTEGTLAELRRLEPMVAGFCDAEGDYQPTVKGTLQFSDWVYPKPTDYSTHALSIFAHCVMDDNCLEAPALSHYPLPTAFLEQLARESLAQSFSDK